MKMKKLSYIKKSVLCLFLLSIAAASQVSPGQRQSTEKDNVKEISNDLAELDALVRSLAVFTQTAQSSTSVQGPPGQPREMVYFQQPAEGKAQPSPNAIDATQFGVGEKAWVVQRSGDWLLAVGDNQKTGWVAETKVAIAAYAQEQYEQAMEAFIDKVQKMKAKYQQGPVRVSGFSIDIKLPPGASVQFEFR